MRLKYCIGIRLGLVGELISKMPNVTSFAKKQLRKLEPLGDLIMGTAAFIGFGVKKGWDGLTGLVRSGWNKASNALSRGWDNISGRVKKLFGAGDEVASKAKKSDGSNHRYTKTGYISGERSNNLLGRDRSTRRTTNLTEWRRSISKQDIGNERRLFLGDDYVKVSEGKWRSLDGERQFRVKPDDYAGNHGIGNPTVPNTPHVHFEFLTPRSNGNGFDVIQNVHVPLID